MTKENKQITSEIVWVTPEMARHWRRTANFERQRNIKPQNVSRLCKEMLDGRFIPGTQVYLCELPNGELRIANGNHTLEAVDQSGAAQCLTITTHKVQDINEIGEIYAVFDIHAARTWRDSAKAKGIDDLVPLHSKVLPAIKVIERGFVSKSSTDDSRNDIIEIMRDYAREAEIFHGLVKSCSSDSGKILQRAGALAVVLETLKFQPSLAAEFWGDIAADDGLKNGMPEKTLLNWLRNNPASQGGAMLLSTVMIASSAWNAKFKGKEVQHLRVRDTSTFHLLGTPHEKGYMPRYLVNGFDGVDSARPISTAEETHRNFDVEPKSIETSASQKSKNDSIVQLGSVVILRNIEGGEQRIVQIARSTTEVDINNGIIPSSSPVAKSMLGKKIGDQCRYEISTGSIVNIIEDIDRN